MSEVAEPYAAAVFDLAQEVGALDAVQAELHGLRDLLADSADLRRLIESPAFSANEKADALTAIAQKGASSPLLTNFLGVLAKNRRAAALPAVIAAFDRMAAEHRGVASAHVASAVPLTDAQTADLTAALKAATGRDVELTTEVRAELLGGLVVQVGSRRYDSSLQSRLAGLKTALKEA